MGILISIIIPCFNQANYLKEALDSVLSQTHYLWECIIVNDGSTDDTEEIASGYCKRDNRFIYLKKVHGGLSSARNAGLNIAKGCLIQFLDSDDTLDKDKLSLQLKEISNKVDIVICDYIPFNTVTNEFVQARYLSPFLNEQHFKYEIIKYWEIKKSIPCHTVLFKAKLLEGVTKLYFDESIPNHEDWIFWVKLFYKAKSIFNLKVSLANYRIHNASMCLNIELMRKGFLLANDRLIKFFKDKNDKEGIILCRLKKKEIKFINPSKWEKLQTRMIVKIKNIIND